MAMMVNVLATARGRAAGRDGRPREILADGRYGPLARVGDDAALAEAILAVLATPPGPAGLRARAAELSATAAIYRYLEVMLNARRTGDRTGAGS